MFILGEVLDLAVYDDTVDYYAVCPNDLDSAGEKIWEENLWGRTNLAQTARPLQCPVPRQGFD